LGVGQKYKKAVYGVILPKVRDFHQAQDLTSETFVTAYLSIESLDAPEKVGTWLCGIARNLANKWLYREKRDDLSFEGLLESTSELAHKAQLLHVSAAEKTPDETAEHAELRQLLWRCLISLPDISSEVLILSYIREMKSAEIAKFLGISRTAVTTRLSDARKRLKQEMVRMVESTIESQPLAEDFSEQVVTEAIKRGEGYLADGHWKSAREQFQRAADVQADYAPAYRGLGMVARELIEEQLSLPDGTVDVTLIEEACTELARAYRLGARDAGTIRALVHLYHQFQRCEEYVDLLWNFAMTTDDFDAGFDAGCRSIAEMQEPCVADHKSRERGFRFAERAVNAHETVLKRFDGQITLADQLDSYFHVFDAYRKVGRAVDWLEQTEHLVDQIGDEITLMPRALYTRERGKTLREWGCHREAAHTYEAFIDWLQNTETVDPEKQALLIGAQGDHLHLAPTYYQLGEHQKVEALLAEAEANLEAYFTERDTVLASITDESEATRERLERIYRKTGGYPTGGSVVDIRRWLNRKYFIGIHIATTCLALGCAEVGDGDAAIRLLNRVAQHWEQRRDYIEEKVMVWSSGGRIMACLAAMMLKFRNDREASLEYLKRAHEDRRRAARGSIKRFFEEADAFESVRHDPEFLAVVNAPVVSQ
jgi:RNA polymerase sigma factor (sigma-70 family)